MAAGSGALVSALERDLARLAAANDDGVVWLELARLPPLAAAACRIGGKWRVIKRELVQR